MHHRALLTSVMQTRYDMISYDPSEMFMVYVWWYKIDLWCYESDAWYYNSDVWCHKRYVLGEWAIILFVLQMLKSPRILLCKITILFAARVWSLIVTKKYRQGQSHVVTIHLINVRWRVTYSELIPCLDRTAGHKGLVWKFNENVQFQTKQIHILN